MYQPASGDGDALPSLRADVGALWLSRVDVASVMVAVMASAMARLAVMETVPKDINTQSSFLIIYALFLTMAPNARLVIFILFPPVKIPEIILSFRYILSV